MQTTELTRSGSNANGMTAGHSGAGHSGSAPTHITPEQRQILRSMVDRNASDAQVEMLILVANRYDLDPILGHVVLISGKVFVTHKGLMHKAHTSGQLDGIETVYGSEDGGGGDWCECRVWRKDMTRPFIGRIYLAEYRSNNPVWKQYPKAMAAKCFDAETEVLTDHGFQPFSSVTGHILEVTDNGLYPTCARPFVQYYSGPMVCINSDDLNFCVTPDHDMVTTSGKIEAQKMYDAARSRPVHWIPRLVTAGRPDILTLTDNTIRLAAIYLADGHDSRSRLFNVVVSREHKIAEMEEIDAHYSRRGVKAAGHQSHTPTRTITTKSDKVLFSYSFEQVAPMCKRGKSVCTEMFVNLSQRQAKLFVDTWIKFDGSQHRQTGARTLRTSRPDHQAAFELACVIAGYSVNKPKVRTSDISARPNFTTAISERNEIGVVRSGRAYHNREKDKIARPRRTLQLADNPTDHVWCVTVPSGVIVVRRHGFSMLCGNCSESFILRRAFDVSLTSQEEMGVSEAPPTRIFSVEEKAERKQLGGQISAASAALSPVQFAAFKAEVFDLGGINVMETARMRSLLSEIEELAVDAAAEQDASMEADPFAEGS